MSQTSRQWRYKVVKRMRGMQGEYFDFPTAATFDREQDALDYAEAFAREQGECRVCGALIDVRRRNGDHVATHKSSDYIAEGRIEQGD